MVGYGHIVTGIKILQHPYLEGGSIDSEQRVFDWAQTITSHKWRPIRIDRIIVVVVFRKLVGTI